MNRLAICMSGLKDPGLQFEALQALLGFLRVGEKNVLSLF